MNCILQDSAYSQLKGYLIASTGLAFYADRDESLTDVIGGRLSDLGLRDCSSYSKLLADGEKGAAEMDVLVAQLTIGESYLFRDPEQFAALRDIVLPDIQQRNRLSRRLRIWSAGCATGAEPYSLAILLEREMGARISDWQVNIYATDLNRSFLAKAVEGKFRPSAFRRTSDAVKRECFSKEGLLWAIHPRYKQWISFRHMNLIEDEFSMPLALHAPFDLILCRNVMIYFAPEASRRLIGQFHQSLGDGGWLAVGPSEHNLENYTAFRTVAAEGTKLYQKMGPPTELTEVAAEPPPRRAPPLPGPPAGPSVKAGRAEMEALRQLANHGDWKGAADYGKKLLSQDRLNPEIHFYQALIFENLGTMEESERSLRHAIYLDRNFAMAHYHLGLALKRNGQVREAARSFGNVLKVLTGVPDEAIVTAGPGVTAAGLKDLARMHLESPSGS